jgi:hypothetical protein
MHKNKMGKIKENYLFFYEFEVHPENKEQDQKSREEV